MHGRKMLVRACTSSSLRQEASFFGEDVRAGGDSHVGSLLQDPQPDAFDAQQVTL